MNLNHKIIPTLFDPIAIVWKEIEGQPKIQRIFLSNEGVSANELVDQIYPYAKIRSCKKIDEIADKITLFLKGENIHFSLEIVDFDLLKPFQKSVLVAEHGIPRGWVSTYQRLANQIGNPKAARAVGNALKNNPFPIIIPCHRAIKSDGTLGGFQGGIRVKRKLLDFEGIKFSSRGRVISDRFYYG